MVKTDQVLGVIDGFFFSFSDTFFLVLVLNIVNDL